MVRWVLTIGVLSLGGCDEGVSRDYGTGVDAGNPQDTGPEAEVDPQWDCDNLCDDADTYNEWVCLIQTTVGDGHDILSVPECPSFDNTDITDVECRSCALQLGFTAADCVRYRDDCSIQ